MKYVKIVLFIIFPPVHKRDNIVTIYYFHQPTNTQYTTLINMERNGIERTRTNDVYQMESIDKRRQSTVLALILACACRNNVMIDSIHCW